MGRFDGKVAIITGASSGIGRATAVLFAKEGAKLTIAGRKQNELEETARQTGLSADNVNLLIGDITDNEVQQNLIDSTVAKFGKLDILVNNAGAGFTEQGKHGTEMSIECYHKNMNVNLTSVLGVCQKARSHLIKSKGEIVNVSSIAGLIHANTKSPYYGMAKAALDQLTRSLAVELIKYDVRVNSVNPGLIRTNFLERAYHVDAQIADKAYDSMSADPIAVPRRVVGTPEEIGEIIAFLADRKASGIIIGQIIVADGGSVLVAGLASVFK